MRTFLLVLGTVAMAATTQAQTPPRAPKPVPTPKPLLEDQQLKAMERAREEMERARDLQFTAMERAKEQMERAMLRSKEMQLDLQDRLQWEIQDRLQWDLQGKLAEMQFPQLPALPPLPPMPSMRFDFDWHWGGHDAPGGQGELHRIRPQQGSPEDSLYRAARQALNAGDYTRAATLFQTLEQKYPRSRVAPAALYYRAFALYRSGSTDHLRTALEALRLQQEKYPQAAADPDAAALRTRVLAALAARGDAQAAAAVRAASASGSTCDDEDMSVRAEALKALSQIDPEGSQAALKRVLARRDECSVALRRQAVYLLGRAGTEQAANDLLEVARTDPDPQVRSDAISILGRSSFAAVTPQRLVQLFNDNSEERTRHAVLSALRTRGDAESRRTLRGIIERTDVPEGLRAEAISSLAGSSTAFIELTMLREIQTTVEARVAAAEAGRAATPRPPREARWPPESALTDEDAAFLRNLYGRTDSNRIKRAIISALARSGGAANEQWLMALVRNPSEESGLRREALSRLKTSGSMSIDDLGKLYDAVSEREVRQAVVSQLASREEPAAVDKLIDIAKTSTDPRVRNSAIQALTQRKNDPKAVAFIRELVEKP